MNGYKSFVPRLQVPARLGRYTGVMILVATLGFIASVTAEERIALVLGNDTYLHAPALKNAVADSRLIASALKESGFEVIALENAGVERFYEGLEEMKRRSSLAKIGLVYFAGHGVEVEGKNYLLPVDAELNSAGQLRTQAVALETVLSDLTEVRFPAKLVILDCCRDNPLSRSWISSRSAGRGLGEVADGDLPEASMVMFSAGPGQVALDGAGDNSPFTGALVNRLRVPGQSIFEAFLGTSDDVVAATGRRQEPWVKFDGAGRAFRELVFLPEGASEKSAGTADVKTMPAGPTDDPPASPGTMVKPAPTLPGAFPAARGVEGSQPGEVRVFEGIEMAWCPPGEFQMGSPVSESSREPDENRVAVTLTKGFWMARTECTQTQWQSLMENNPSQFKGETLPVENVSWEDSQRYLVILNARPQVPPGWHFVLPTEAQWEYACRAGSTSPFSFGGQLNGVEANCDGRAPYGTTANGTFIGQTAPVGAYPPNSWGLLDMHGNVLEWCADWYGGSYSGGVDPVGPSSGQFRVSRGGSWHNYPSFCRAARRYKDVPPTFRGYSLGFRVSLQAKE